MPPEGERSVSLLAATAALRKRASGHPTDAPINLLRDERGAAFATAWVATHQADLYQGEDGEAVLASLKHCLGVCFATGYNWARDGYPLGPIL